MTTKKVYLVGEAIVRFRVAITGTGAEIGQLKDDESLWDMHVNKEDIYEIKEISSVSMSKIIDSD
ncbi:hypothetical protein [Yersinia enterocolitica]|uniref:hypothetical protein n=1 Tax=Yersinia enterocolitica TaxID=630 RepID=UPI000975C766|nr:hypothetical protein [Yersinia enterocolitica]